MQQYPEPEYGLEVDPLKGVDSDSLLVPAAEMFNFDGYCGYEGEPEDVPAAESVEWRLPSLELEDEGDQYNEGIARVQNGTWHRWMIMR
jgi:hypothetical protein